MARKRKRNRPAQGNNAGRPAFRVAAKASPEDMRELASGRGSARDRAEAAKGARKKGRRRRRR
jgi:hypothetical protein